MANELNTAADIADRRAIEQYNRQEMSKTNKAIHAFGGESRIIDRIASGQTVVSLCEEIGITGGRFYDWVNKSEERRAALARAREVSAHSLVEQTAAIVDAATPEDVAVAKLRAENRWRMAKAYNKADYAENNGPAVNISLGDLALDSLRKRASSVVIDAE
jgi:hypothetical protein